MGALAKGTGAVTDLNARNSNEIFLGIACMR